MFSEDGRLRRENSQLRDRIGSLETALRQFAQAERFKANSGTDGLIVTVDTENEHPELHFCCVEDVRTATHLIKEKD